MPSYTIVLNKNFIAMLITVSFVRHTHNNVKELIQMCQFYIDFVLNKKHN